MKLIAHRGNLNGPGDSENDPKQIEECIRQGYDVEIDVWSFEDELFLGHDQAERWINIEFLLTHAPNLWCHCKNLDALTELLTYPTLNCFFHQKDNYTITSHGYIWAYPGQPLNPKCVAVMPEWNQSKIIDPENCYGICTDYILTYALKFDPTSFSENKHVHSNSNTE